VKSSVTRRLAPVWVIAGGLALLASCGGGGGGGDEPPPPPPVSISVTPTTGTVKLTQTQQFTATVANSSNTAVSWALSGPGCTGAACGTIDNAGLYSAPAVVPVPPTVSVTATAQADTSKSAAAALTIASDVQVAVWPPLARVTVNNTRQFLRTLSGHANDAVIWSLSGAGCTGASCGSVSSSGIYTAPAAVPNPVTVSVRATSVVDLGKSATASIALQPTHNRTLSGTYAYLHRGLLSGFHGVQAGTFTANGDGVITSGVQDSIVSSVAGGNRVNLAFSGTYAIGSDNRGLLSFALAGGGVVDWRSSHTASGDRAFMQPFYDVAARGNAVLHRTDPSAFNNTAINGDYVFQFNGADVNGQRIANIGRFTANGAGSISAGLIDSNDGTTLTQNTAFTGTYNISTNGRGTAQLSVSGQGSSSFAVYVVSAEMLIIVSTDDLAAGKPIRIGYALRQSGAPFGNTALQGNHVFELSGGSANAAVATTGLLSSDGAGAITGMLDRNDNYVISAGLSYTASYSVAANGRGTLSSSALPTTIFYLTGSGKALLMQGPGAAVQTGTLERQLAAPYSTANLIGQFASGSSPPVRAVSLSVTGQNFYNGLGMVPSVLDIATPCGLAAGASSDAMVTVAAAGRIDVRDFGGVQHAGGYLITPVRYVLTLQRASGDATCDEVVHHYTAEQ